MNDLDRALWDAIPEGNLEKVKALIAQGANINATNPDECGECMLAEAMQIQSTDWVQELLQLGANPDVPDCAGITPLVQAVFHADFQLVRLLLRAGANPNTLAFTGDTPQTALDAAFDLENVQETDAELANVRAIQQLLLDRGATTHQRTPPIKNPDPWIRPEGLTVADVQEITRVVAAHLTGNRAGLPFLEIHSIGAGAEVRVGELDGPLCGAGFVFTLERTAEGWRICGEGEWIA